MRGTHIMQKKRIAVLFGGASSEHDVSTVSALGILSNIDKSKYEPVLLGITKQGEWFLYDGDAALLPGDRWLESKALRKAFISPDPAVHGILTEDGEQIYIDAVFPILHGKNGEDGTVQGLLQLARIPFVGCDSTSSGVCMDKAITNAVMDAVGIKQAKWLSFSAYEYKKEPEKYIKKAFSYLGSPIFVKPANAGSSVGVSKASTPEELRKGIEAALKEDKKAVLEEFIDGFEVECAVLGNDEPIAGEVGEIRAAADFYDYDAKYNNPNSQTVIPAGISEEKRNEVRATALKAYKTIGCEGLSRVDFFVRRSNGEVLLNEINTIPGQTPISMYPKLFEAVGISYARLIDRLIELAFERGGNF